MKLREAIKSGRKFRRPCMGTVWLTKEANFRSLSLEDIFSDDWKVQPLVPPTHCYFFAKVTDYKIITEPGENIEDFLELNKGKRIQVTYTVVDEK